MFEAIVENDGEREANEGGFRICVTNTRRCERAQKKLNIYRLDCELRVRVAPSMNMQEVGIGEHLNVLGPVQLGIRGYVIKMRAHHQFSSLA